MAHEINIFAHLIWLLQRGSFNTVGSQGIPSYDCWIYKPCDSHGPYDMADIWSYEYFVDGHISPKFFFRLVGWINL